MTGNTNNTMIDNVKNLAQENQLIHAEQEELLLQSYEAATLLHFDHALELLEAFEAPLLAHMEFEESVVLPKFESLREQQCAQPTLEPLLPKQVAGDHIILHRTIAKSRKILNDLVQAPKDQQRRELVKNFDELLRIRRVLEHHTMRETRELYTPLEILLKEDEQKSMLASLRGETH